MSNRESGYYWVRFRADERKEWIPGEYFQRLISKEWAWDVLGSTRLQEDDDLEIGPRILPPEDVKQEDVVKRPGLFDA